MRKLMFCLVFLALAGNCRADSFLHQSFHGQFTDSGWTYEVLDNGNVVLQGQQNGGGITFNSAQCVNYYQGSTFKSVEEVQQVIKNLQRVVDDIHKHDHDCTLHDCK